MHPPPLTDLLFSCAGEPDAANRQLFLDWCSCQHHVRVAWRRHNSIVFVFSMRSGENTTVWTRVILTLLYICYMFTPKEGNKTDRWDEFQGQTTQFKLKGKWRETNAGSSLFFIVIWPFAHCVLIFKWYKVFPLCMRGTKRNDEGPMFYRHILWPMFNIAFYARFRLQDSITYSFLYSS